MMNDCIQRIIKEIESCRNLLVITGAGISTNSGISDYRDQQGSWKRPHPIQHSAFMQNPESRKRYWSRSQLGYPVFKAAEPNSAHADLARMEKKGKVSFLITQNVDRLHQKAGHQRVLDLHGRLDQVRCTDCGLLIPRDEIQDWLEKENAWLESIEFSAAPDGDADIDVDIRDFKVPECISCRGILKPDVVFFGDSVSREVVDLGFNETTLADAVIVIGSSLMVFSSFRFIRHAYEQNKPIYCLNRGKTRADELFTAKAEVDVSHGLSAIVDF